MWYYIVLYCHGDLPVLVDTSNNNTAILKRCIKSDNSETVYQEYSYNDECQPGNDS